MESGSDALRGQQSSVILGIQTVNTLCFAIDVEITRLVYFYGLIPTTYRLCFALLLLTRIVSILLYNPKNPHILL